MKNIQDFVKERNDALLSMNEDKIRRCARKYGIRTPINQTAFWGGVYKAICNVPDAPKDVRWIAEKWLRKHGMSVEIGE